MGKVRDFYSGAGKVQQQTIRVGVLVTVTLWILVGATGVAAWVLLVFTQYRDTAELMGLTSAILACPAAVAHVRLYCARLAFIIRTTANTAPPVTPPTGLRSVN